MNHLDKLTIEDVKVSLKLNIEEETALDTYRVSEHPKRLKIKGRTQTLCPKFSAIGRYKKSYLYASTLGRVRRASEFSRTRGIRPSTNEDSSD